MAISIVAAYQNRSLRHRLSEQQKNLLKQMEAMRLETYAFVKSQSDAGIEAANSNATSQHGLNELQQQVNAIQEKASQQQTTTDHLLGEAQNLAVIPTWHPARQKLTDDLLGRMKPILDSLTPVLFPNQIPMDDLDWMYRLPDKKFPYSLTFEEGMMLHFLVSESGLKKGYEIATAFGFSSFFLATAFQKTGGHLVSADAYIEEEIEDFIYDLESAQKHVRQLNEAKANGLQDRLPVGLRFAMEGAELLGVADFVDYQIACSPQGVPDLIGGAAIDFAFIDGGHFGEQPILDVRSVVPHLSRERFLIVFHDTQCEAVAKAVHVAAQETGCVPFSIHTRNRIVVLAKGIDSAILNTCREMTVRQFV